jgi:hypothetical protein
MLLALTAVAAVLAGPGAGAAAAEKPVVNLLPEVVGRPLVGERLGCGTGSWLGTGLTFTFRWLRAGIPVREGVSYTLRPEDEHKELWCVVTATRGSESTEAESINSITLGGPGNEPPEEAPNIKTRPEVSGEAKVGATLSCSQGAWNGGPTSYAYTWLRDKTEPIREATLSTYRLTGEDEGRSLSCKVTASNKAGFATAESSNSIKFFGQAPKPKKAPVVVAREGLEVGKPLECFNPPENWDGTRPLTFKYGWLRNGVKIASAGGSTYLVEEADEGQPLKCEVTATNSEGSSTAVSAAVTILREPPKNTKQPKIEGVAKPGETLKCAKGTWTGAETFEYEWVAEQGSARESVGPRPWASTYQAQPGKEGYTLYCTVIAKNKEGRETSRDSEPFVIAKTGGPKPKIIEHSLQVFGKSEPEPGESVTCSSEWENAPTKVVYQWVRDAGQGGEVSLESGTGTTYKVASEDAGHTLSCRVTALNQYGEATALSAPPRKVKGGKPVLTGAAPELIGDARVGESITCLHGAWSAAPKPTYAYQWHRNGELGVIGEAAAYTVVGADRGSSLTCTVTAKNSEGSGTATTSPLYIPGSPPEGEPPSIEVEGGGEATLGATLKCVNSSWNGAPAPTFTYQWLLNGVAIPEETMPTYSVTSADRGRLVSCSVTGSSPEGSATETSKSLHVPGTRPQEIGAPQISGSGALGATLTCNRGIWRAAPPPAFTYQWYRDGVAIASATASTYVVESADQGHLLSCNVTAANIEGHVEAESSNGVAIPIRLATSAVSGFRATGTAIVQPSAAVILAAVSGQLTRAERGLRLRSVLKHGGFSFAFTAPTAGTLELQWYKPARPAHGSSKKGKSLLVGRTSMVFTAAVKRTVHLKLTAKGRQALRGQKRVKLTVKAVFTAAHGKAVSWTGTLVLSH